MLYLLFHESQKWLISVGLYSYVRIFDQLEFRALAAAFVAFTIVLIFGRAVINRLRQMKIADTGLTDAVALAAAARSKGSTPSMGGVLIVAAILLSVLLLADVSNFYVGLAIVVLIWLSILGGVDDWLKLTAARRGGGRQGLYAWEKLIFQLGLATLVGYFVFQHANPDTPHGSMAHVLNLPFQKTYDSKIGDESATLIYLPLAAFLFSSICMVAGMSNAANISDGMDGLLTGVTAAVACGVMVLALVAGQQAWAQYLLVPYVAQSGELAVVAGAMAGACLGFLWFNCSPAAVFMGDTGSLALGGVLGYISLVIRQELLLAFMCLILISEIGSVVLQVGCFRLTKGKRIFKCAPYHHHLHLSGWTEQQVVARFWIITILLVVVGLATVKMR